MLFILELMAAIAIAMFMGSGQLGNFTFETSRANAGGEVQFLDFVGGKINEDCTNNNGTCTGVTSGNLPATLGEYYTNVNPVESATGTAYTITIAPSASGNANQQAFVINDPAKFTVDELADIPYAGGGTPPTGSTLFLHYDPCHNGVYSSTNATESPSC